MRFLKILKNVFYILYETCKIYYEILNFTKIDSGFFFKILKEDADIHNLH